MLVLLFPLQNEYVAEIDVWTVAGLTRWQRVRNNIQSQNPYTGPTKGTRGVYVVTRVTNAIWQTGVQAGWRAEAYSTNSLDS